MIISYTFHTICFNKIIFIKIDNDFYACYFKAIDTKGSVQVIASMKLRK